MSSRSHAQLLKHCHCTCEFVKGKSWSCRLAKCWWTRIVRKCLERKNRKRANEKRILTTEVWDKRFPSYSMIAAVWDFDGPIFRHVCLLIVDFNQFQVEHRYNPPTHFQTLFGFLNWSINADGPLEFNELAVELTHNRNTFWRPRRSLGSVGRKGIC